MLSPFVGRSQLDPGLAFGKVLRVVRTEAGLTQEQLALAAGVDRSFVSMVERGVNQPTIRMIFRFAAALGVAPSRLVELTEAKVLLS
ncbi:MULTISPECIES: helix-turn-helix domain-containing protein [Massilia]|uniref:Helix-turn-helix domain-containing protein n=1 Tax=Massilia haematophila TaxID=457923 RepID=A0ABV7PGY5_9BURK